MTARFEGKVALVTGASSGIGRASALAFARDGAKVVVADVAVEGGEETVRLIEAEGGEAVFVTTDVSNEEDVKALINTAVETFGRLDYAHNNAGIEGEQAPTAESTKDNWDRVIAINLTGVYLCMKYEIPRMLEAGGGAIVNTSSAAGLVGSQGIPAYVASKHGVIGITKVAALEYSQQGIRVNAVCPGVIETPMIARFLGDNEEVREQMLAIEPIGRFGTPEEVAEVVVWLCSDESSYVTGVPMPVDGAMVAQ